MSEMVIDGLYADLAAKDAEIARLRTELDAYRGSVRIDAQMDGPKFMGCNLSQLRRAWEITTATEE